MAKFKSSASCDISDIGDDDGHDVGSSDGGDDVGSGNIGDVGDDYGNGDDGEDGNDGDDGDDSDEGGVEEGQVQGIGLLCNLHCSLNWPLTNINLNTPEREDSKKQIAT